MNYVDLKYSRLVSPYLDGWKEVGKDLIRFRCPFCGDSKKSETKTRGYFYAFEDRCNFKCHNCSASMSLQKFLAEVAPSLAGQYTFERFSNSKPKSNESVDQKFITTSQERLKRTASVLDQCQRIRSLPEDHHARKYLDGRQIPERHQNKLFYVEDVRVLAANIDGYRDRQLPKRDCIVIPFFDTDGVLMYLQCRFFDTNFRYMTFQIEEDGKKIWGMDHVDWSKRVYVCEGPFDAMFVDNCIAVAGVSIMSELKYIQERCKSELVLIFDKDYMTNYEVFSMLHQAVKSGHRVVLYDGRFKGKDINAQITDHHTPPEHLMPYLEQRTFGGLAANLELSKFRQPKSPRKDSQYGARKAFF